MWPARATGGKAQKYAITGPGWAGEIPEGVTQVKSPTALVWILGRVYCTGTPEDYKAVHELQDQYSSVPLSSYGKPYTPPAGVVDEKFDMKTAVRKQVNAMSMEEFVSYFARSAEEQPPETGRRTDRGTHGEDWDDAVMMMMMSSRCDDDASYVIYLLHQTRLSSMQ